MNKDKNLNNVPCLWTGNLNIVKMSFLPKLMYRFNVISIKIPASYFGISTNSILKFIQRDKRPSITEKILKGRTK